MLSSILREVFWRNSSDLDTLSCPATWQAVQLKAENQTSSQVARVDSGARCLRLPSSLQLGV
jgi:hypothetical protein